MKFILSITELVFLLSRNEYSWWCEAKEYLARLQLMLKAKNRKDDKVCSIDSGIKSVGSIRQGMVRR